MPTLTALGNDGQVVNVVTFNRSFWTNVRDASSGVLASSTVTRTNKNLQVDRGSSSFLLGRAFFAFDCSGISSTVASATLKIYGYTSGTGLLIAVKASAPNSNGTTALATSDFDAIPGFSAGNSMNGNVTDYSAALTGWNLNAYNDFTLNSTALSDLQSNSIIQIAIVNYTYDYLNSNPGFVDRNLHNGMYWSDFTGTSTDPIIDYTLAATAGDVASINDSAIGNISFINDNAKTIISSINGIDLP